MSGDTKAAIIGCLATVPLLAFIAWFADILTRDIVGGMVLSHGGTLTREMMKPIWPSMLLPLIAIWTAASVIAICLAMMGVVGPVRCPEPPAFKDRSKT